VIIPKYIDGERSAFPTEQKRKSAQSNRFFYGIKFHFTIDSDSLRPNSFTSRLLMKNANQMELEGERRGTNFFLLFHRRKKDGNPAEMQTNVVLCR
jgi:hypothetical protein